MKRDELIQKVQKLGKDVFDTKDLRKLFPEESINIKISIKRLRDLGIIHQVTRGVYMLRQESLDIEKIATQLYYPSYISFESALSKYGIINQGLYGLTLATTRHSKQIMIGGVECSYSKLQAGLFFGFDLIGKTYVADPEKALLDELYLVSRGKKTLKLDELDLKEISKGKFDGYAQKFPRYMDSLVLRTRKYLGTTPVTNETKERIEWGSS